MNNTTPTAAPERRYTYHEEGGHSEELPASSMEEAIDLAEELCREGSWGSGRVPSGLECIKIWWDAFQAGRLVLLGRLPRRRLRPAIIAAAVNKTLAAIAPVVLRSATSGRIGDDGVTLAASANGAVAGVTGRQILAAFPRGGIGRPLRTPMRTVGY